MAAQSRNIAELENAPIWRLLVQYSLPSIAGMVVYSLYNIIDSVFIGHGVGPLALSGLAVTFPIMNLTFALGTLVGIGGAAISSIRLGKKDQEGTERTLGHVLIMSLIAAVVLAIPTLLFLKEILTAFGASGQTLSYAYDFMLVTLLGLPVTYVFFNLNHVMRATGYPKKAMGSTLLSVGINITVAPIFIFWFKWGITGAALATLLAQITGMVRVLLHFSDPASTVRFRHGIWQLKKAIVTSILSIGLAPCLVNVCGSAVTVAINRQLADHGGDLAIGAYGIINRILILFAMLVIGLTQGMQPIIGYNHGAMKPDRVLLTLKYGVLAATSFTTLGFLACILFPRGIAGIFTDDAALIGLAANGLTICMLAFPLIGSQIIIGNFFQAIGKPRLAIFLSLTRQMLFLLPFLLVLPRFWGQDGVWASLPLADVLSFIVTLLFIRRFLKYYRLKNRHYLAEA
ncbi:MATE family efflux transporter [Akkermansia sp.]|uniref:MATE family efflux transporter n=2 Tax=Akkermansia TaxID=239934 RepID=UPI0025C076C1|nr:MATE family efflux transporter [Akkermansia sp.]MCC8149257.1 MATE family efflux transporter [Akkermansia sp.]